MPTNIGGRQLGDFQLAGSDLTGGLIQSVTSTLNLTQMIVSPFNVVENDITWSQSISYTRGWSRSVTSTLSLSQDIKKITELAVTSTITWTETQTGAKTKPRTVTDTLTLTPTVDHSFIGKRLVVSGITWSHTRGYNASFVRLFNDPLDQEQVIHADHCVTANNIYSPTQTISYTKGKLVVHTLEFGDSFVHPTSFVRSINTIPGLNQTIVQNGRYNRTISQGLTWGQTIVAPKVKGISQTLTFNQTIGVDNTKHASSLLSLGQTIGLQMIYTPEVVSSYVLTQPFILNRSLPKEIHHGAGFSSFPRMIRVNTRGITSSYSPAQQVRFSVYVESVTSNYNPSQTVGYTPVYPRTMISTYTPVGLVANNQVIVESVTSQLTFLPVRSVYVGMGDVEFYNVENLQYSLIPAYLIGKKNVPHCVLQVNNDAITLPAPEFGDAENYGGVFTIRRSMNNIPYTHVRTLSLRKLNLPFVLAKRKAWELREFLIRHNPELMTLTTWKGDKWFVNLTTNPLELRVSGRYEPENEKVSVDLEFEGLKVM